MIVVIKGIVFNYIKFRETSIIAKILTQNHGIQSFIVKGIRSPKSKRGIGHFQTFNLLEMTCYWKQNQDIHHLTDFKIEHHSNSDFDFNKEAIIIFLSEIIGKMLQHDNHHNHEIFDFLWPSLIRFNLEHKHYKNYHIETLIRLCGLLGFGIYSDELFLEICKGNIEVSKFIQSINKHGFEKYHEGNSMLRKKSLDYLIVFLQSHFDNIIEIKSLKVLETILH